jgi:transketolase
MLRLGDHCGQFLRELAKKDDRIWVIDGDLADSDGAMHFSAGVPDRFIMAGIAEQSMVSMAAGMASCGLRPWVFSFAAFLVYRAYDQIRVCLSQCRQPVVLVGSHSGALTNRNGKSHAALNDIALMATLPHIHVWSPADPADLFYAANKILQDDHPAYLRLPRKPLENLPCTPGLIRVILPPQDVTIVSTGLGTQLALETQRRLAANGIKAGLIHCLLLSPLPSEALLQQLSGVKKIYVIEDHSIHGGLYTLILSLGLNAKIIPVGWPQNWSGQSGSDESIMEMHGVSPAQVCNRIIQEL